MDDVGLTLARIDELIAERTETLESLRRAERTTARELDALDTTRKVLLRYAAPEGAHAEVTADTLPATATSEIVSVTPPAADEGPRRIRSTQLAAKVVRTLGYPVTKDQVIEEFDRQGLIPASWTNARSAITNALNRAMERGEIRYDREAGTYSAPDGEANP